MSKRDNVTRLYDAGKFSDYNPFVDVTGQADYVVNQAGTRLRDYARWLDENVDLAIGGLDVLVNNVVGTGIQIEPQVKTRRGKDLPQVNERIRDLWKQWTRRADITGELPWGELQRLVARSWIRDGEVFNEHIQGNVRPNRGRVVPYSLRLLEADWLPFEVVTNNRDNVVQGVRKDEDGIPIQYLFFKQLGTYRFQIIPQSSELRSVPAERIEHLKFSRRLNQTRGVSVFSGVIRRLQDIQDTEVSERVAMRVASAFTAVILKQPSLVDLPSNTYDTETGDSSESYKDRYMEMSPGAILDTLLPGEDIKGVGLDRPNTALIPFLEDQHRRVASGIGCSASSLTKNYEGSYSSKRQERVEQEPSYSRLRDYFVSKWLQPVYERFLFWAVESGALSVPREVGMNMLGRAEFRGPAMPWIDPAKEMKAYEIALKNHIVSRKQVIRERGDDPELVDAQIQADMFAQEADNEGSE